MVFIILILCASLWFCNAKGEQKKNKENPVASLSGAVNFDEQIKPIFQKNCMPCHFPGGKMYERMPFDKDTTIISHATGILRRIKNKDEVAMIEEFIKGNK